MDKSNLGNGFKSANASATTSQVLVEYMLHLRQCRGGNCKFPNCNKMRRLVAHSKTCKKNLVDCPICLDFFKLQCLHSHHCENANCPIPNCKSLKDDLQKKLRERRLHSPKCPFTMIASDESDQQNLETKMSDEAKIETVVSSKTSSSLENCQQDVTQENLKLQEEVPDQVAQDRQSSNQNKQVPGLQEVLEALLSPDTSGRQDKVLQILKSNPPLMAAFNKKREALQKQREEQRRLQIQAMLQQQLEQRLQRAQQQQALAQQDEQSQNDSSSSGLMNNSQMQQEKSNEEVSQNSDGTDVKSTHKLALQELVTALKSPGLLEDQTNKCIEILKNNPPLVAAFVQQRQARALEQQDQQVGNINSPIEPNLQEMINNDDYDDDNEE